MKRKFTKMMAAFALLVGLAIPMGMWGQTTYEQLTSIANIDENAQYVLGIDGTGFHYEGTSSWGKTALPSAQTPIFYTLTKATDGNSFTAKATISGTLYYLQVPTSNTFSMATSTGTNTDLIIGTTQVSGTNYAVANKTTTTRHLRLNGTSGLRSYASTTGTMAYFYKVVVPSGNTYTVTYHANVTGTADIVETYNEGADVTVAANTFSNPGYAFTEWNTNAGGTDTGYQPGAVIEDIDDDWDFYAQWEESNEVTATLTASNLELATSYSSESVTKTIDGITYEYFDLIKNSNNIQARASSGTIKNTTAYPGDITSVVITHSGTARATTINGSADGTNWTQVATGDGSITADFSGHGYKYFQITRGSNAAYWTKIEITYSTGGGSSQTTSDLAITGAPVALSFDLYNNNSAQTVSYTTSSTGTITITPETSTYFSYVHDATAKTITVTPLAVTPSAQTVTISQAADDDYYAGTATFTVSIANSTPLANIAALTANNTAGTYSVTLSDAVVTFVNGSNAYIQDASGAVMMHKSDHGLTAGDVFNGTATVTFQLYNANPQITEITGVTPVSGTAPNPTEVAQSAWSYTFNNVLSQYFKVTGATITQSSNKYYVSLNNESIQLYKSGGSINSLDLTKTYSITGFPTLYNSTKELTIYADPEVETSTEPSITVDPATVSVDAEEHGGTLALTYENLEVSSFEDFVIQFYDADENELNGDDEPDWIDVNPAQETTGEYVVSYFMLENEGEAHTAYFKVATLVGDDLVYSNLVTITQAAPEAPITDDKYVKVTSTTDLTDGQYLIVYEKGGLAFDGSLETLDAVGNTIAVTISNNEIAVTETTTASEFTINTTAGTIKSASGFYIGQTSDANGLASSTETQYANTISFEEGNANIVSNSAYLRYNKASNQTRFRYYKSSSYTGQEAIQLYKKVETTPAGIPLEITGYGDGNGNWYLITSPLNTAVSPSAVTNMIESDGHYDLYSFNQSGDEYGKEWINYKNGAFSLEAGQGYLYARKTTETLYFPGDAYVGDNIQVTLTYDADADIPGLNLVGNPFNSEAAIVESGHDIYAMNGDRTEIALRETNSINPMEGIFVVTTVTNGETITIAPVGTASGGDNLDKIAINLSQSRGNVIDRAVVRMGEGRQLPKFQLFKNSTKVYIPQNGKDYAVVSAEAQGELPVNFRAAENGTYTLSIDTEDMEMNYLHLIDNLTGMDIDLLQTPSYTFEANVNDYESRFRLVFAGASTGSATDDSFAFYSNGNLIINNEGNATLQVVDLTGRILSSESVNGSVSTTLNAPTGVYMLRLINGDNVKVQKIVVR